MRRRGRSSLALWFGLAALILGACSADSGAGPASEPGDAQAAASQARADAQTGDTQGSDAQAADEQAADAQAADAQAAALAASPDGPYGGQPPDDKSAEGDKVKGLSQDQPADENPGETDDLPEPPSPTLLGLLVAASEQKVTPLDPESNDEFGWSLAIDGATLVSGAPLADDNGGNSGTAYVFDWTGERWVQSAKLVAEDGREGDWFGKSAAVSGDYAVVGANLDDGPLRNGFYDDDTGSAYVFVRERTAGGEVWRQQQKLRASLQIEWAEFGFDVEIDGDLLAVAAYHDPTAGFDTGAVYVFRREGQTWVQEAQLLPSHPDPVDEFGIDIDIDGDTILVGAHRDDLIADDAGAAYVFRRRDGEWVEEAILRAPQSSRFDSFGWSVDLHGDLAVVGAPFADGPDRIDAGAAYVFERRGSNWFQLQRILPSDPFPGAWFGRAVGIAGDYVVVGAPRYDHVVQDGEANELFNIGVSYVFRRTEAGWVQVAQLRADDAGEGDDFGWTIAMTDRIALVGAWLDDTEAGVDTGSFYSYVLLTEEQISLGS